MSQPRRLAFPVALIASLALLAACSGSPTKRVSPPAASIQQLTVDADGGWKIDLRLQNYSGMPMRFDSVELAVTAGGEAAGTLRATPAISIGPESADVVEVAFVPASGARIAAADALASRRSLAYELKGKVTATPETKKPREFEIDSRNSLSPAPGLDGVLR
ncbi:MAG: LEA type 2 family protein [Pseudoxanthomonas sp.]